MKVLVACEESQRVCTAFRKRGHEAYSRRMCAENALNLINRQKAEIERLNTILSKNADTAFQDGLDENRDFFKKEVEPEIRNEAIKEFAERLKRYSFVDNLSLNGKETVYVADIDNVVKEMTEAKA